MAIVAPYSQLEVASQVASSDQGSHMPEMTGICCVALQMRPRPVFLVMTGSLVPERDLKGAVPEQGRLCTAGMPGCAPQWPCAQLLLCQTWAKCSDDKIVRAPFFFPTQYLFSAVAKSFIPTMC